MITSMFTISKKSTNQKGQVLLIVCKNGELDKAGNAYVQQQVPEDFADYLLALQEKERKESVVLDQFLTAQEAKARGEQMFALKRGDNLIWGEFSQSQAETLSQQYRATGASDVPVPIQKDWVREKSPTSNVVTWKVKA